MKTAGQVGLIKLLSFEKLRGGVRIELKAGNRALKDYNERFFATAKIGEALAVKYNETAEAVLRLMDNNSDLKFEITKLKRQINDFKVNNFTAEGEVTAIFEEDLEIKELQVFADALYKKAGGIRAVFSSNGENTYAFAICSDSEKLDKFFADFKSRFNVKGGGRNGMVQGTVTAKAEELKSFFN